MATPGAAPLFAPTYRAAEMRTLAGWIASGVSGSVVGLVGCGRSNVLRFLCEQPQALQGYMPIDTPPIALVPVDLYDLPSENLADLYRTMLHAFYWVRERLAPPLAERAAALYLEHRASTDSFLTQTALYELLLAFQNAPMRVVLVMNRFDRFCETSTPQMVNTLRSLRDRFKETLTYIVGMRQEVAYLPDPAALGDMYELFDSHICFIGALADADGWRMLASLLRSANPPAEPADVEAILRLSGGFPSLLKAVGQWWMLATERPAPAGWATLLLEQPSIQHRLERMWQGLTQEEKLALSEIQKQQISHQAPDRKLKAVAARLAQKGCCVSTEEGWRVRGDLLDTFVAHLTGRIRGRIWLDETAGTIYQGHQLIQDLTPLEYRILRFLASQPRLRHTSDTIIDHAWPANENKEGVTPNNLQVHISSIRKKIEPDPAEPRFLLTWHGRPGGYQFFPEGKPE
jgi:hypothetical protein